MARPSSGGGRPSGGGGGGHRVGLSGSGHRVGNSSRPSSPRPKSNSSFGGRPSSSSGGLFGGSSNMYTSPPPPPPRHEPPRHSNAPTISYTNINVNSGNTYRDSSNNRRSMSDMNMGSGMHGGIGSYGYGSSGGMSGGMGSLRRRSASNSRKNFITGTAVILIIAFVWILTFTLGESASSKGVPASTVNREKLNTGGFSTDCIVDNDGWFSYEAKTEKALKNFFKKTGVQPYIVINPYMEELTTDAEKEEYAKQYYMDNELADNGFMYMYFGESDPNMVGYMYGVVGTGAGTVMDSEAQEIFWSYFDYWWSVGDDLSSDELFINIFNDTAKRIMDKQKTIFDVLVLFGIVALVVIVAGLIIRTLKLKAEIKHQEAEDTARILEADISGGNSYVDDLTDKYSD